MKIILALLIIIIISLLIPYYNENFQESCIPNSKKDKLLQISSVKNPKLLNTHTEIPCGPGTTKCKNAVGYCYDANNNEMVSTYRVPKYDPPTYNRTIDGQGYYVRRGAARAVINMADKKNPNNCTI